MLKFTNKIGSSLTPRILILAILSIAITACGGTKTFNDYARAGDTVAIAGGWQQNFNLDNIVSIRIKKGPGPDIATILQGDPAIRASVNFYADPLSSLVVSRETGIEFTPFAHTYEDTINNNNTLGDKDWYQTTVFVDLPATLVTGTHTLIVTNTVGETFDSKVEIIAGVGSPSTFSADGTSLNEDHIAGISRLPHYIVEFSGSIIPHAIELTLTHDPEITDMSKAYAVNPIGYKKNLAWTDDGTTMKAILTPTTSTTPDNIIDYKFYVTGAITNLSPGTVLAFDINGDPVPNVTATVTASN